MIPTRRAVLLSRQRTLVQRVSEIFSHGLEGAWYDFKIPYLTQVSDGTSPVDTAEQPIGRVIGRSPNGNNAIQATAAARPTYSQRYNLAVSTEDISSASWARTGSATATVFTDPEAGNTYQIRDVSPLATYVASWEAKKGTSTGQALAVYDITNATFIIPQIKYDKVINGTNLTRVSIVFTVPAGCVSVRVYEIGGLGTAGTTTIERSSLRLFNVNQNNDGVVIGDSFAAAGTFPVQIQTRSLATITNKGTSGNRLYQMEARFAADVVALTPDFVVIEGGINDLANAVSDPNASMQAAMISMIQQAQSAGIYPIVLNTSPWKTYSTWSAQRQAWQDTYNAWLYNYAVANGIRFVDLYLILEGVSQTINAAYDSGDGLHPNATGYTAIGSTVAMLVDDNEFQYQRVTTATDYDTAGFLPFGKLLGTDDNLTSSTGGGGSAGFCLVAALTPAGGAGTLRTLWSDNGTNTGRKVQIDANNKLSFSAGDGTAFTTKVSTATLDVGTPYVITVRDNGTNLSVQINRVAAETVARPVVAAGTAGYTIGKDNGAASSYMISNLYHLDFVNNADLTDAEVVTAQAYAASTIGLTL